MVAVDSKARFANHVAELHDVLHKVLPSFPFVPSVPFRGQLFVLLIRLFPEVLATKKLTRHETSKSGFANYIAELQDVLHKVRPAFPFVLSVRFRGQLLV